MKNTKKLISILLVALLLISTAVVAAVSAGAAETLASVYQTNPNGQYGKQATITIDGSVNDWSEDMMIARGAAWDCPNHWKGSHENSLADCYALFAAYDSTNLYIGMQFVNTTDTWQRPGDASLMDGGKMGEIPIVLGLSVDPSSTGMTGKLKEKVNNKYGIWGLDSTFQTHVDHLFFMSAKVGTGTPAMFTCDSTGASDYAEHCKPFSSAGISYKKADTNICSEIWGLNYSEEPSDVFDDNADWVDYKTFTGSKGKHDISYDTFYEMAIPFSALGTTASYVASNGIGAIFFGSRGESMMDCVPFDGVSMLDNAKLEYRAGDNTSKEKEDDDLITVPLARIGAQGDAPIPTTPITPTTPTTPTEPTDPVGDTLTVNSTSNLFPTSTQSGLSVGDTLTVKYDLKSSKKIASADWSLSYDSSKLRLKTSGTALCPVGGGVINDSGNPIYGNFTDVTNQYDFTSGDTFVQAEFEVLAAGTANVNLNVEEMNVLTGTTLQSVVENSVVKSVSGVTVTPTSQIDDGGVTPGATLTVRGTSNLFDDATGTFDETTNKVTVSYRLKSSKNVANAEWKLTYDTSKLSLDTVSMPKTSPTLNTNTPGTVFGNFTDTGLVSYSTMDDFVVATFDVLGTGTTTVNLQVINLGIGNPVPGDIQFAYLVDDGVVKNISGQSGFSGYTYSTQTLINAADDVLAGDVDLNGTVNIQDATLLQRYFAEYTTLTSAQLRAADANKDGKVNIRDVTQIQRIKAGFVS